MTKQELKVKLSEQISEYLGFKVEQGGISGCTKAQLEHIFNNYNRMLTYKRHADNLLQDFTDGQNAMFAGGYTKPPAEWVEGQEWRAKAMEIWHNPKA